MDLLKGRKAATGTLLEVQEATIVSMSLHLVTSHGQLVGGGQFTFGEITPSEFVRLSSRSRAWQPPEMQNAEMSHTQLTQTGDQEWPKPLEGLSQQPPSKARQRMRNAGMPGTQPTQYDDQVPAEPAVSATEIAVQMEKDREARDQMWAGAAAALADEEVQRVMGKGWVQEAEIDGDAGNVKIDSLDPIWEDDEEQDTNCSDISSQTSKTPQDTTSTPRSQSSAPEGVQLEAALGAALAVPLPPADVADDSSADDDIGSLEVIGAEVGEWPELAVKLKVRSSIQQRPKMPQAPSSSKDKLCPAGRKVAASLPVNRPPRKSVWGSPQ